MAPVVVLRYILMRSLPVPATSGTVTIICEAPLLGAIYAQRDDDAGVGTKIMNGPSTLTFNYLETAATPTGTATVSMDATPASATEVQITLTATRGGATTAATIGTVTTKTVAYVALRNTLLGP